jgi:hypothetical protein
MVAIRAGIVENPCNYHRGFLYGGPFIKLGDMLDGLFFGVGYRVYP